MPPESQPELPITFRGYDRAAADAAFAVLEKRRATLANERDELRRHVDTLTRELEEHRAQSQAVADALITAQKAATSLRESAQAEIDELRREVEAERRRVEEEGAAITAAARHEATEIVREARLRADRLIGEVLSALEDYRRQTDEFVTGTRERLASLVHDLLDRLPGSAPTHALPAGESHASDDAAAVA